MTLAGYLLFAPATTNTGARIVISEPAAELAPEIVGELAADLTGEVPAEVECG